MSENIPPLRNEKLRRLLEAARHEHGEPHPRDILKREYDEAQKRPRNVALEKWGPVLEEWITRDLHTQPQIGTPTKRGVDIDREYLETHSPFRSTERAEASGQRERVEECRGDVSPRQRFQNSVGCLILLSSLTSDSTSRPHALQPGVFVLAKSSMRGTLPISSTSRSRASAGFSL